MVGQYDGALQNYARAAVQANTSLQLLNGIQSVVLNIGLVSVTLLAGMEVLHGQMSLGGVTACILILQQVYAPLFSLGMNYREIRQAFIDMEQMLELMAITPEIVDAPNARALPPSRGRGAELRFQGVGFQHTARSVGLDGVDFVAAPGTTTALVGPSGAGKTTMVRLALRLIDPQAGRVLLDGVDLRDVSQASLRRAVALVPQDVALFNDTLWANIAFADPKASSDAVWAAAEAAEAGAVHRRPAEQDGDSSRRARSEAFRRRAPARRPCPRPARQPAVAGAGRGDQRPRRSDRGGNPGHSAQGPRRAHHPRCRPPPLPPSPTPTRSW